MNQFNSLPSESAISPLAQVASNEAMPLWLQCAVAHAETGLPVRLACENTGHVQRVPTINRSKLVLRNLCVPMEKRISADDLQAKVSFARTRGNLVALHARIHAEVQATIAAMRAKTDALMEL